MIWHAQKRWRLHFRVDPDAGRVMFIGPFVISFDVRRFPTSAEQKKQKDGGART